VDATCRGAERRSLCGGAWWRRLGRCKRAFGCCSLSRCCCSTSPSLFLSLISPNKCSTGAAAFALTRSAPTSPWSEDEQKGRNVFCDLADFFVLFFFFFFSLGKDFFCGYFGELLWRSAACRWTRQKVSGLLFDHVFVSYVGGVLPVGNSQIGVVVGSDRSWSCN
jgi:hypothetical protein